MKKVITSAVALAVAIFAIGGSWITNIAPPEEIHWGVGFSVGLATVVAVGLAIVIPLLDSMLPIRYRKGILVCIGLSCLILTVVFAYFYWQNFQQKTVVYPANDEGVRVVIGSEFTENAKKRISQQADLADDPVELMSEFEGLAENVWTSDSIKANQFSLSRFYLITSGLMASFVICLALAAAENQGPAAPANNRSADT